MGFHTEKSQLPLGSLNPRCGSICLWRLSTGVQTLAAPAKLPGSTFITVPLLTKNTFPQLPTLQQMSLFGSLEHCKARPNARPNTSLRNQEEEVPPRSSQPQRTKPSFNFFLPATATREPCAYGSSAPMPWVNTAHQALGPGSPPRMHIASLHSHSRRDVLPSDLHHHLCPTYKQRQCDGKNNPSLSI